MHWKCRPAAAAPDTAAIIEFLGEASSIPAPAVLRSCDGCNHNDGKARVGKRVCVFYLGGYELAPAPFTGLPAERFRPAVDGGFVACPISAKPRERGFSRFGFSLDATRTSMRLSGTARSPVNGAQNREEPLEYPPSTASLNRSARSPVNRAANGNPVNGAANLD
jgi:hypothetical protein